MSGRILLLISCSASMLRLPSSPTAAQSISVPALEQSQQEIKTAGRRMTVASSARDSANWHSAVHNPTAAGPMEPTITGWKEWERMGNVGPNRWGKDVDGNKVTGLSSAP
ncbi:hypothetical protein BDZ91DRAFT_768074 [Kalaharituber pfeilii]|nr:hypothetical protein BDZ91DRAFT_768074 [Kalaharituber pfeilii]